MKFTVSLCCLLISLSTFAQNSLRITGTVKDSEGLSVISAVVRQTDKTSNATVTDKDGKFKMILPKDKSIEISCLGYITKIIKVDGKEKDLDITLVLAYLYTT